MYISKNNDSDFWEWIGQISNSGYGRLKIKDEHGALCMRSAQHISYEAFIGSVEKGILVMQTCRNRLCINPNTSRRSIRGSTVSLYRGGCAVTDAAITDFVAAAGRHTLFC
jgi:hypothetical protein